MFPVGLWKFSGFPIDVSLAKDSPRGTEDFRVLVLETSLQPNTARKSYTQSLLRRSAQVEGSFGDLVTFHSESTVHHITVSGESLNGTYIVLKVPGSSLKFSGSSIDQSFCRDFSL